MTSPSMINIDKVQQYNYPFRWWIMDRCFTPFEKYFKDDISKWEAHYDNDTEKLKKTSRHFESFSEQLVNLFDELREPEFYSIFSENLNIELENDSTMHGGGLHMTLPNGFLSTHLDYAKHPIFPDRERRVNVIAFLNKEWHESWGGALIFCDPMGSVVQRIYPKPGRIIAFETSDDSYHGVEKVTGPESRYTAAVYYLSPLRSGVTRQRALFMPNRG
jgi:Rps23 Pro-64 3,4-dihydroxylase Tpa1-like proline 4-hydroxylase